MKYLKITTKVCVITTKKFVIFPALDSASQIGKEGDRE